MRVLLWLVSGLVLSACAAKPSVSEFQCKAGDWQTIGYRDGASGLLSSKLLAHQDACGAYAIVPDRRAYLSGWREGVSHFCTAANGFDLGSRGQRHNSVCVGELAQPFVSAYTDGLQIYTLQREVNDLAHRLQEREQRLHALKREMTDVAAAQLDPVLTAQQRIQLVADLHDMAEERGEILAQIPVLEEQLAAKEIELERVQQLLAEVAYN
ncbi:MAG: DUF2799 domain-containing protein [Pseudomonadota bacterium]